MENLSVYPEAGRSLYVGHRGTHSSVNRKVRARELLTILPFFLSKYEGLGPSKKEIDELECSTEDSTSTSFHQRSLITSTCKTLSRVPYIFITRLGHLLLISTRQDFSLKERCPNARFKYVKFPDSFHACLVQISNGVCDAFDAAHRSMKRISVKCEHIAMDAKAALELMEKGTRQEWRIALHRLQYAEESCLECVKAAKSITEEFEKVGKMIDELYETLIESKGKTEDEEKLTRGKNEEARDEMERMTKSEKNLDERCDEAKKEYEDAAAASPAPWKTMFDKLIDGITYIANFKVESLKQTIIPQTHASTSETAESSSTTSEQKHENEIGQITGQPTKDKDMLQYLNIDGDQGTFDQINIRLNEVMCQWEIIRKMFQNVTEECRKGARKQLLDDQEMSDITRETIIQNSKNAMNVACMVHLISSVYVETSSTYFLVGVDNLHNITLLESSSDQARMEEVRRKLEEDAEEAEREITKILEKKRKLWEKDTNYLVNVCCIVPR